MSTILILARDQMGDGDAVLGRKILATMLRKAFGAYRDLDAIAFYNAGVKLLAADSPVLAELRSLERDGVDLLPCGTCVEYYGLELAIGTVSDMDTILREIDRAAKVVTV